MRQITMIAMNNNTIEHTTIPIIRKMFFVLEPNRLEKPETSIDKPLFPTDPTSTTTSTASS
jgi:hypothetical protein